jgi:antitoxin YefM
MHTVYRLKASEIDQRFIDALKATFQDREIEIVVYEVDETAYLLASKANRSRLLQAAEHIKNRESLVEVEIDKLA